MEQPIESAPAPLEAPVTISAQVAAVNSDDFSAFQIAEKAATKGEPLPRVEVEKPRELSKRQIATNDAIREAVERATADTRKELDTLRAQLAAPKQTAVADPPKPVEPPKPLSAKEKAQKYLALPDAPKLEDFESIAEFGAAQHVFIDEKIFEDRQAQAHATADRTATGTYQQQRIATFDERVTKAAETDPGLIDKIRPLALDLPQRGGAHSIIAELVLNSEHGPQLLNHFTDSPAELDALAAMPTDLRALPRQIGIQEHIQRILKQIGRLEGTFAAAASPASAVEPEKPRPPTIANIPPPPQNTITRAGSTTDPQQVALKKDDFASFHRIETDKRMAKLRG